MSFTNRSTFSVQSPSAASLPGSVRATVNSRMSQASARPERCTAVPSRPVSFPWELFQAPALGQCLAPHPSSLRNCNHETRTSVSCLHRGVSLCLHLHECLWERALPSSSGEPWPCQGPVTLLCVLSPHFPSFSDFPSVLVYPNPWFIERPCAFETTPCLPSVFNHGFYQEYFYSAWALPLPCQWPTLCWVWGPPFINSRGYLSA